MYSGGKDLVLWLIFQGEKVNSLLIKNAVLILMQVGHVIIAGQEKSRS